MKKTILSVLLVLLLCFVLGCGKEEEPDPAELNDAAIDALKEMGINPKHILVPAGCTFVEHKPEPAFLWDGIYLIWKGADIDKYNAYKTRWENAPDRAVLSEPDDIGDKIGFDKADISFSAGGGNLNDEVVNIDFEPGSIVLYGRINKQ